MYKYIRLRLGALTLIRAIALFVIAFALFPMQARAADPAWQGVWRGTLGKQPIVVCLDNRGRSAYFYVRYQREIALTGKDGAWEEYNHGALSGIWTLSAAQGDELEGHWRNPASQRTLPVDLNKLTSADNSHPCDSMVYRNELSGNSSVTNSLVAGVSANVTNTSVARASRTEYAYFANYNSNKIFAYRINATTGALIPVKGSPFATKDSPVFLAASRAGTFLYALNHITDSDENVLGDIVVYRINATTGEITPIQGNPFCKTDNRYMSITIGPTGTFAYVTEGASMRDGYVSVYYINTDTGALTPVPGGSEFYGGFPKYVLVNPADTFVYVSDNDGITYGYHINVATDNLAPAAKSSFAMRVDEASYTINPAGTFAYGVNIGANARYDVGTVSTYRINPVTGKFSLIRGSASVTGSNPNSAIINPAGTFVYVVNSGPGNVNGSVSVYRINASTHMLTPISSSPFPAKLDSESITINHANTFAYVANEGDSGKGSISAYRINVKTGALTPIGSPLATGGIPGSVTIVQP